MRPDCPRVLTIALCLLVAISIISETVYAEVIVDGTKAQRDKIARWLTLAVGTTVAIGADGKISVEAGGNKAATRLRNMVNDATTSVRLHIVDNDNRVSIGGWNSGDPSNPYGKTTGTQEIDIKDLEGIGNVINSYGVTPGWALIHEITEVYEGKKSNLNYGDAHKKAIEAEEELMKEHGTSWVFRAEWKEEDGDIYIYRKIKRPDGTYVVVRRKPGTTNEDHEWFKEKVPCETAKGLIAIADPDPQVRIFSYDFNKNHFIAATWDSVNSHPTGVAYDKNGNLYVSENIVGQDEIRIFDPQGNLIGTITGQELSNPEGISVDKVTGDIFVAVDGQVIRYDSTRTYLGWYDVSYPAFDPSDVAVWRNLPTEDIYGAGDVYDIYVSDRAGKIYRFNVTADMNTGTYRYWFGSDYLVAPEGLSIDSWGQIWVASTGNNRIYRFLLNGDLSPFGARQFFVEDVSRKFFDVEMLDFDGIYVIDETPSNGALILYDYDGNLNKTYGTGTLQCPESIAINFKINAQNLDPFVLFLAITTTTGGTTYPTPGTYTYEVGNELNVIAIPNTGCYLHHWELDGINVGTTNPIIVTMNTNRTLKAAYAVLQYALTITTTSRGTTTPEPGVYTYSYGTVVDVTALPNTNYRFDHWVLDGSSYYDNPISIAMNTNHVLYTVFAYSPPGDVGGFAVSVDKFGLLAPYIGLASAIMVSTIATAVYVKRVKRGKEKH